MDTKNTIKLTLIRSLIGAKVSHKSTIKGLGLKRLNSVSVIEDTPSVRGMINKVSYLVKVEV